MFNVFNSRGKLVLTKRLSLDEVSSKEYSSEWLQLTQQISKLRLEYILEGNLFETDNSEINIFRLYFSNIISQVFSLYFTKKQANLFKSFIEYTLE